MTESQLALLVGQGRDPLTGEALGRAYPAYKTTSERTQKRLADLDPGLRPDEIAAETVKIEADEASQDGRRAVAGYDLTFSVPKSVSVLWGVADAKVQELIVAAHHAAVGEVLGYVEREVAATRTGVAAGDGAVAQVAVHGVNATAFDHWDSRSGDPQLHTHVVISNKVQAVLDGRWRSLDGRPMHAAVTALSAYYDALLADRLTGVFGFDWEPRVRGTNMHPHAEISGVPESLVAEFSSRTRDIDRATEDLITDFVATHGRQPSDAMRIRMRAHATLATRPKKQTRFLADLTDEWRIRAGRVLDADPTAWARGLAATGTPASVSPHDIGADAITQVGADVVAVVGQKRSTWRHWNLWSEASRQTMHWRFADAAAREQVIAQVVAAAEGRSVALTPPELASTPPEFRRDDGSSVFRPRHARVYSSAEILAAEDRLLARADDLTAPRVRREIVERVSSRVHDGHRLTPVQAAALVAIATSGRQIDVLVGPAGAGKTTAMHALQAAWRKTYGADAVVGLAPSAAAAAVLAADLEIPCENTAMWLTQHALGRAAFRPGQLVIIDEATLADTATLDHITALAAEVGAKVLLVGDWAQLQSVDAGGAFGMLAQARPDTAQLIEIHRFTHAWEKTASLNLRAGRDAAIAVYDSHDRIHDGTTDEMLIAAYDAWRRDTDAGLASVLVTESTDLVRALNTRARADRILSGATASTREAALADGTHASPGDHVITRRNNRQLRTSSGLWVRNGDLWRVKAVRRDGSLVVCPAAGRHRATILLPGSYVAAHVDLGYAITAHRAQGLTVDTAHVLASPRTTRENLYVSMTRGRESNTVYVALDSPDEAHAQPPTDDDPSARSVLFGILQHADAEISAHQTITIEQEAWGSIAQLAAEYDTIAAAAQRDRWTNLIRTSGLTSNQADAVIDSDTFGPLTAALRRAEAHGHDVARLLPKVVARHGLDDADDIAAVLQHRIGLAMNRQRTSPTELAPGRRFIAGFIPRAVGSMDAEIHRALKERADLIEARASELAQTEVTTGAAWTRRLGCPPPTADARRQWMTTIVTVAAYRDRYQITSDLPLGPGARTAAQRADRTLALVAQRRAIAFSSDSGRDRTPTVLQRVL